MKRSRREWLLAALAAPAASLLFADDHKTAPKQAKAKMALGHGEAKAAAPHGDAHDTGNTPSADEVVKELMDGNTRFASGQSKHPRATLARLKETSGGQHPHAVVLTCADSRVPPEIFLDQGIGDIFTIRVAGNVANNDEIASAGYAIEHFGSPVCVVLGHAECGAVKAVVNGDKVPEDIQRLVVHIGEAFSKTKQHNPTLQGKDLVAETVRVNVWESVEDMIKGSEIIQAKVRSGALRMLGGVYQIDDGKVDWMGVYPGFLTVMR